MKIATTITAMLLTTGCASIMRGSQQQIFINAYDAKSGNVISSDCILSNDEGTFHSKSGRSVLVGRDKDYLTVDCHTDSLAGRTIVDGKVNWGFWAIDFFLIDACIVSCWIDGLSGSWAEYPSMIDIPMDAKQ